MDKVELSGWTKILSHFAKPECRGEEARFAQGFAWAQLEHPLSSLLSQLLDMGRLPIRGHEPFQLLPQVVHRVQFGPLPGQPHQFHTEFPSQAQRLGIGMSGGPVQQKPDRRSLAVATPYFRQKRPGIGSPGAFAAQHDTMSRLYVDGPKQHALGLSASN